MIPFLGTALWGWTIDKERAFALADQFYDNGGRWFDTATNYPITKRSEHFNLAEKWLAEWMVDRSVEIKVLAKIGAISNDGSDTADLSQASVTSNHRRLLDRFGPSLRVLSVHWDNRDRLSSIRETVAGLAEVRASGLDIGLSGIRHPEIYADAMGSLADGCWIQIKHNVLSDAAYRHYHPLRGRARFLAYGVNAGGLKISGGYRADSSASVRSAATGVNLAHFSDMLARWVSRPELPSTFNELGLAYLLLTADLEGVILGPSKTDQLVESLAYLRLMNDDAFATKNLPEISAAFEASGIM